MKSDYYNEIAKYYDQMVKDDLQNRVFPYGGYEEVQNMISEYIDETKRDEKIKILDLGIGTASMYEKLLTDKLEVVGVDFSSEMLEVAKLRLPDAKFYMHDILKGLPEEIQSEKYDFIIINYLFKHFDIKTVIELVKTLKSNLATFGKMFIGDIMFLDDMHKKIFLTRRLEYLSNEFHYHLYAQMLRRLKDDLALSYMEINEYTGIVIIENYYDYTLQFEESLVKYKSNTVKWKSSHPQKKRE